MTTKLLIPNIRYVPVNIDYPSNRSNMYKFTLDLNQESSLIIRNTANFHAHSVNLTDPYKFDRPLTTPLHHTPFLPLQQADPTGLALEKCEQYVLRPYRFVLKLVSRVKNGS